MGVWEKEKEKKLGNYRTNKDKKWQLDTEKVDNKKNQNELREIKED